MNADATSGDSPRSSVFSYLTLRFLIGLIALSLAHVVIWWSQESLISISASYHTDARDVFVGSLFIVAAFLFAYNGHSTPQFWASKLAGIAAAFVAIFPTTSAGAEPTTIASIHTGSAIFLFAILAYFCLGPFQSKLKNAEGPRMYRRWLYLACGGVIVAAIVFGGLSKAFLPRETVDDLRIIYWIEKIALTAFGVAWLVAARWIPWLVDEKNDTQLRFSLSPHQEDAE